MASINTKDQTNDKPDNDQPDNDQQSNDNGPNQAEFTQTLDQTRLMAMGSPMRIKHNRSYALSEFVPSGPMEW